MTNVSRMSFRLAGILVGSACWSFAATTQAQCSKDTDCKGERVCEQGSCVSLPAPSAVAQPATPPVISPAAQDLGRPPVTTPPSSSLSYESEESYREAPRRKRNGKRNSPGMMAGGIVMVSVAPISLLVGLIASMQRDACQRRGGSSLDFQNGEVDCGRYDAAVYGGLFLGVGLIGAGIPLIVVGAKRKPLGTASLSPWATPQGGGLNLRLDL